MQQQYMDYHFHSNCSPDSQEPLENHIFAAEKRGLSRICLTDHWDLVEEVEGVFPTLTPDISRWHSIYEKALETAADASVQVLFGVEVGDGYENPAAVFQVLEKYPFDFIIGSVHSLHNSGGMGIYEHIRKCNTEELVKAFFEDYFHTLLLHSELNFFDTLAHMNYPFRYLGKKYNYQFNDYLEQMTAIFENLIKKDRCFELNTCRGSGVEVWEPALRRYRDMGGKNITIGSDAHVANHLGLGVVDGVALLSSLGFTHYTAFEKRVPHEVPILS